MLKYSIIPQLLLFASGRGFATTTATASEIASSDLSNVLIFVGLPATILIIITAGFFRWFQRKNGISYLLDKLRKLNNIMLRSPDFAEIINELPAEESAIHDDNLESLALENINRILRATNRENIRECYRSIGMTIKGYITEKYRIKAIDMTTGEILDNLPEQESEKISSHIGEILRSCELIEFRRYRPSRNELIRIYRSARNFIMRQQ